MAGEPNVFEHSEWERDLGVARGSRLAPGLGLSELGCALYELDPGGQAAPYHVHHGNEELLIVIAGELELRTPEGSTTVRAGDVAGFPAGAAGAHRLRNASDAPARYVLVSTMRFPDIAEQLDTGTVLAIRGPAEGWAFPAGSDGDYMALTSEAIEADPK